MWRGQVLDFLLDDFLQSYVTICTTSIHFVDIAISLDFRKNFILAFLVLWSTSFLISGTIFDRVHLYPNFLVFPPFTFELLTVPNPVFNEIDSIINSFVLLIPKIYLTYSNCQNLQFHQRSSISTIL